MLAVWRRAWDDGGMNTGETLTAVMIFVGPFALLAGLMLYVLFFRGGEPDDDDAVRRAFFRDKERAARQKELEEKAELWERAQRKFLARREEDMLLLLGLSRREYECFVDPVQFDELLDKCEDDEARARFEAVKKLVLTATKEFFPYDYAGHITKIQLRHAWKRFLGGPLRQSAMSLLFEMPFVLAGYFGLQYGMNALILVICLIYAAPVAVIWYFCFQG